MSSRWIARLSARVSPAALAAGIVLAPAIAAACACGCGIFNVGGVSSIMPDYTEGDYSLYFRYAYVDQDTNWRGESKAPAALNEDKRITTSFYTVGGQWRVNPDWTILGELPIYDRRFTSTDDGTVQGPAGSLYTGHVTAPGDLQIIGSFTGLLPDRSTGILAGVKLPTGDIESPRGRLGGEEFDADTMPGTGSTDIIIGAFHNGSLSESGKLGYYVQARAQYAIITQNGYRPGDDYNAAMGVDYTFDQVKPFRSITPMLSLLGSYHLRDSGVNADWLNTGYARLLIAPGVQLHWRNIRLYGDVEFPIYQRENAAAIGQSDTSGQLVASTLFKVQVNYDF